MDLLLRRFCYLTPGLLRPLWVKCVKPFLCPIRVLQLDQLVDCVLRRPFPPFAVGIEIVRLQLDQRLGGVLSSRSAASVVSVDDHGCPLSHTSRSGSVSIFPLAFIGAPILLSSRWASSISCISSFAAWIVLAAAPTAANASRICTIFSSSLIIILFTPFAARLKITHPARQRTRLTGYFASFACFLAFVFQNPLVDPHRQPVHCRIGQLRSLGQIHHRRRSARLRSCRKPLTHGFDIHVHLVSRQITRAQKSPEKAAAMITAFIGAPLIPGFVITGAVLSRTPAGLLALPQGVAEPQSKQPDIAADIRQLPDG